MIEQLSQEDKAWLARFFATPNELSWSALLDGSAPPREADQVRQWLAHLGARRASPLILPFVRGGKATGWYATTQNPSSGYELGDDINAWLGPTWLSRLERVPTASNDPMAAVLRDQFGGSVYRFTGADSVALQAISVRLSEFAKVLEQRPLATRTRVRPVGAIRGDFERALLAGDEARAGAMIAELKQTGRLTEENLRYLQVRLNAGLGLWPQIARDHWLIKTLGDLTLPPQVLADLIEALYRTYVEEAEIRGDKIAMREAFAQQIATPFPKLFATRRGIRAPRVIKAFLLFEQIQANTDAVIINGLVEMLPSGTDFALFVEPVSSTTLPTQTLLVAEHEADEALDDGQFDRAFEFYLRLPLTRKTISRLVSCVGAIGTIEARDRLLTLLDEADLDLVASLAPGITNKIASLREARSVDPHPTLGRPPEATNPWIAWAEKLRDGRDLAGAAREVHSAPTNWDALLLRENGHAAQRFTDILGGLDGEASVIARAAVPQIFASVFKTDAPPSPPSKPVASLLFLMIAMGEALSRADLDLLAELSNLMIEQGLSAAEYMALMDDLGDIQKRIGSYAYLSWSLDLIEVLGALPSPSSEARDARLWLFLQVLSQAAGFAHRLEPADLLPIETLAKDYGVGREAVTVLKRGAKAEGSGVASMPNLVGKTIGIYTLAEAAGKRAKAALEDLFEGCKVVVNSDLVATPQLSGLARTADLFVFAWKSSSHQAFYCVKEALAGKDPIWAPGKGTASILRAVVGHLD